LFFDFGGLVGEFGSPMDPMNFSLEDGYIKVEEEFKKKSGVPPEIRGPRWKEALQLESMTEFLPMIIDIVPLGDDIYALKGELKREEGVNRDLDFEGLTFRSSSAFSNKCMGVLVANKKDGQAPFDCIRWDAQTAHFKNTSREAYLIQLVGFLSDPTEAKVRFHFNYFSRRREHKNGEWWIQHRLKDRWGDRLLKDLNYDYAEWSERVREKIVDDSISVLTIPNSWKE
jgi:hypothetical protein